MNVLKMKIVDYDEASNSLIVTFASDVNKKDVGEYPNLAYQPTMFPDVTDPQEILKRIAISGIHIASQQAVQENFVADSQTVDFFKSLKGQVLQHNISDLIPTPPAS